MGRKSQKSYWGCGFVVDYGILKKEYLARGYLKVREQMIKRGTAAFDLWIGSNSAGGSLWSLCSAPDSRRILLINFEDDRLGHERSSNRTA